VSLLGAWAPWYDQLPADAQPAPYGDSASYRLAATWLEPCERVEDWGSGTGWLRRFVPPDRYVGVDGTPSPFTDVVADLARYRTRVPGICLRHVLEHNRHWPEVLDNALGSFTRRMCLVLFSPMDEETREVPGLFGQGGIPVPVISFCARDLERRFPPDVGWTAEDIASPETWFGVERLYYLER
jgi:hypothetical protein